MSYRLSKWLGIPVCTAQEYADARGYESPRYVIHQCHTGELDAIRIGPPTRGIWLIKLNPAKIRSVDYLVHFSTRAATPQAASGAKMAIARVIMMRYKSMR